MRPGSENGLHNGDPKQGALPTPLAVVLVFLTALLLAREYTSTRGHGTPWNSQLVFAAGSHIKKESLGSG